MALCRRRPKPGLIHQSDQGVQYAALEYEAEPTGHGVVPSMSKAANNDGQCDLRAFHEHLVSLGNILHREVACERSPERLAGTRWTSQGA